MDLRIPLYFNKKTFVLLFIGFIVFTVAGTVLHELGHFFMGRLLGYKGQHISYAFASMGYKPGTSPGTDAWDHDHLLFLTGGPLQTMATGTIGFLLLCLFCNNSVQQQKLGMGQWCIAFLTLFWLRELFNFIIAIASLLRGKPNYDGDEFRIASYLHWNGWWLSGSLALVSCAILAFVVFTVIPPKQRLIFLSAGLSGGIAGALLWLVILGPKIMP